MKIKNRCDNPPMFYSPPGTCLLVDNHSYFVLLYHTIKHDLLRRKSMRMDEFRCLVSSYRLLTDQNVGEDWKQSNTWYTQVKSESAYIKHPSFMSGPSVLLKMDLSIRDDTIIGLWLTVDGTKTYNLNKPEQLPLLLETLVNMYRNVLYSIKFDC